MSIGQLDYTKAEIRMMELPGKVGQYRLTACAKEPWTVAWIEGMGENHVLYDVGANVGSYSLLAAKLGHMAVAIEPLYFNYAILCQNIQLNEMEALVLPFPLALDNTKGWRQFVVESLGAGGSTPENGPRGEGFRILAPMLRMDDLVHEFGLPAPTHIKIDVDGGEVQVLAGGERVLRAPSTQSLLIETRPATLPVVTMWLNGRGWKMTEQTDMRNIHYVRFERA